MAKQDGSLQEAQRIGNAGGKPTGRFVAPTSGGRVDRDTSTPFLEPDDFPEPDQNNPNMNTTAAPEIPSGQVPEAQQIVHPNILDIAPVEALEEPVRSNENWVVVRPNANHSCFIGDRQWHFFKDKAVRVPRTVAEILGRGGKIYPIF